MRRSGMRTVGTQDVATYSNVKAVAPLTVTIYSSVKSASAVPPAATVTCRVAPS